MRINQLHPMPPWSKLFMNRTEPTAASHFNCFKLAENRATSSPWVGSHPYTSISCASKLLRFQSDLKLKNLEFFPGFPGIPRNHGTPGSCLKSAENRAASSPWVGGHRYTDILFMLKLPWAQRNLMLENLATGTSLSDIVQVKVGADL